MKRKAFVAALLFVSTASVGRSQAQAQSLDQGSKQAQELAPPRTDAQNSEALHDAITKPEPHLDLQKLEPPPQPSIECREYKHHLLNIHFDDRTFNSKCKNDGLTPRVLPYEYGPTRKQFWGMFAIAGASMVAYTEVYEHYNSRPTLGRATQYSAGATGLGTIIVISLPRTRPKNVLGNYKFWSLTYTTLYTGLTLSTIVKGKH